MSDFDFFDGLDTSAPLQTVSSFRAPKPVETFPCLSCHGTGRFVSPHGRVTGRCFACAGKGHHAVPHHEAMRAKAARKDKIVANKQARRHEFQEANPELFRFMAECTWSEFIRNMFAIVADGRKLSDAQLAAVVRTFEKSKASQAERNQKRIAEQEARSAVVDLTGIHAMFDKARSNGLNELCYRAEGLVLTPAKAASANAGGIYVKTVDGTYLGKVMGAKFLATREAEDSHKQALNTIAENPSQAAKNYGFKTGRCSCCGRKLTNAVSVALGIGPVCADNYGF